MSRPAGNVLLSLGAVCLVLLLTELVGHALVKASPLSYGTFLGRELPPFRVVPACDKPPPATDTSAQYRDLMVDGQRITVGDLYGMYRDDPALGHAPVESAVSANAWWQSNNLGARDRHDASVSPDAGRNRIVIFGESFGAGSRIKQEQVWSAILARAIPETDVLNFSVDGYGMTQAYLRFLQVGVKIKYNAAIMMFVPKVDLPRDINVFRPLLSREWPLFTVLPRFVMENGRLVLAQRPDETEARFIAENCRSVSDRLRAHLARYDRLYFDVEYRDGPPLIGESLLYKLGVTAYTNSLRRRIANRMMRQGSEALDVTKAIFWHMDDNARQDGGKFVLVFLPIESELERLGSDSDDRSKWRAMVDSMCGKPLACIDLASYLPGLPASQIDRGYDGSHYGPVTNRLIGEFIAHRLMQREILGESPRKVGEYSQ